MVFNKGHKSNALRLFGFLLGVMALIGTVAYFINSSTDQTNKVSFKAAGVKYKEHFIVSEFMSRPEVRYKNASNELSQKTTNENSSMTETAPLKNSTNSTLTKKPVASESIEISSDLQVLSSFDCMKSIPTVLMDYMSNMFLYEYGRSHEDFHSQQKIDETLPQLKKFNINCDKDQNCSTSFQYDKQYGLNTTGDNTYQRKELFYCCPSVHISKDEPISNICKRAQTVVGKSVFRDSKDSTFLGRVTNFLLWHT